MPVRALETNEIEVFDININRVKCALAPAPAKYWIMKQTDPDDANGFIFYAASYEAFTLGITSISKFPKRRQAGHIGYAECERGMIYFVEVKETAQGCGIGKVLSSLCMLDPSIHKLENSKALASSAKEWTHGEAKFLEQCRRLIGLNMSSKTVAGGFAYINAAHLTGYQYLVVQVFDSDKSCVKDEFVRYEIHWIRAEGKYNGKTGLIAGDKGTGKGANWLFCSL